MRHGKKNQRCLALLLCLQMVMLSLGGAAEAPGAVVETGKPAAGIETGTTGTDFGTAAEPAAYVLGEEEPRQWRQDPEKKEENSSGTPVPSNEGVGDDSDHSESEAERVGDDRNNSDANAENVGEHPQVMLQNVTGTERNPEDAAESTAGVKEDAEGYDGAAKPHAGTEDTSNPEAVILVEEPDGSMESGMTGEAPEGPTEPGTAAETEERGEGSSLESSEAAELPDSADAAPGTARAEESGDTDASEQPDGMDTAPETAGAEESENADVHEPSDAAAETVKVEEADASEARAGEAEAEPAEDATVLPVETPTSEGLTGLEETDPSASLEGTGTAGPDETGNAETANGEGGASSPAAQVFDLSVTEAETEAAYRQLRFHFISEGQEYYCFVTGLRTDAPAEHEGFTRMAQEIADSFLRGEGFTLSSETALDRYGLELELIDAEKIDGTARGDRNMCWAASAADLLEMTGWNVHGDEDGAFSAIRDAFSDLGSYQEAGISWYLDGINTEQYITTGGRVAYRELNTGAAQQLQPGTGGYWTDYAAGEAAQQLSTRSDGAEVLDQGLEQLEEGYGLGLGAYYYQDERYLGSAHALTVFGYIREMLEQAAGDLRALILADSDDRAENQEAAPENRPDEYVMYRVAERATEEGETYLELTDYGASWYQTRIGNITVLAPRSAMAANRETEGTRDARNTANLIPEAMTAVDGDGFLVSEAEAGSEVTLELDFMNRAYEALPEGAVIRYAVHVYLNGELTETVESSVATEGLRPMRGAADSLMLTLAEAGEYTFGWEILGIQSADGSDLQEAYTRDNSYSGLTCRVTVQAAETENTEAPEKADGDGAEIPERKAEKIYRLTVVLATDRDYTLFFESETPTAERFRSLWNRETHAQVDPKLYTISKAAAGYEISFEKEMIEALGPGDHMFVLYGAEDRVLIQIRIL